MDEQNLLEKEVGDYRFLTVEDAQIASAEERKIQYLRKNIDFRNPENVEKLYRKLLDGRVFQTPVGDSFLLELRHILIEAGWSETEKIPVYREYATKELRDYSAPVKERIKRKQEEIKVKKQDFLKISLLINIGLVFLILAMFYITVSGPNPNILNYERVIVDKYASWEQELTQRENEIKEKERAYNSNEDFGG